MNNFKTTDNGGLPLRLDDFRFMHNASLEVVKGLISPLVGTLDALILSGCEATNLGGGLYSYSEGYVYFSGEVFYFPAISSTTIAPASAAFDVVSTFDPTGVRTFNNSVTHNVYEIRRATITTTVLAPSYPYSSIQTYNKTIHPDVVWNSLPPGSWPSTFAVKYCVDSNGFIHFDGAYGYTGTPPMICEVGILPIGVRPLVQQRQFLIGKSSGSSSSELIELNIYTDGRITIEAAVGTISHLGFYFNSISPISIK